MGYDFIKWITTDGQDFANGYFDEFTIGRFSEMSSLWETKKYSLTFKLQNGTYPARTDGERADAPVNVTNIPYGTMTDLISKDVVYTGYHLLGWALTDNIDAAIKYDYNISNILVDNNITLYAVYKKAYSITLNLNYLRDDVKVIYADINNKYTLTGNEFSGKSFDRFNTSPIGEGDEYLPVVDKVIGQDLVLYAMWYKVSFLSSHNLGEGETLPKSFYVTKDVNIVLPQPIYNEESNIDETTYFAFKGFSLYGVEYNLSCDLTQKFNGWAYTNGGNRTIYNNTFNASGLGDAEEVNFETDFVNKDIRVDLYFKSNPTDNGTQHIEILANNGADDKNKVVISNSLRNFPSQVGYELDYIKDVAAGSNNAYFVDGASKIEIDIPAINVIYMTPQGYQYVYNIYCVWKKNLTINANNLGLSENKVVYVGATHTGSKLTGLTDFNFEYTSEKLLSAQDYNMLNPHRKFVGFSDDALATDAKYSTGDTFSLTDVSEKTIFVIWEKEKYTLTISNLKDGGTKVINNICYEDTLDFATILSDVEKSIVNADGVYQDLIALSYNGLSRFEVDDKILLTNKEDNGEFEETDIVKGITLQAVWAEREYEIYAYLNGGKIGSLFDLPENATYVTLEKDGVEVDAIKYVTTYTEFSAGLGIKLFSDVTRAGYAFSGYKLNSTGTEIDGYAAVNLVNPNFYYTLKAGADSIEKFLNVQGKDYERGVSFVWIEEFKRVIDPNGGESSTPYESETKTLSMGDDGVEYADFTLPDVTMTMNGASFEGFYFTNNIEEVEEYVNNFTPTESKPTALFKPNETVRVTRDIMNRFDTTRTNTITFYAIYKTRVAFECRFSGSEAVVPTSYVVPEEVKKNLVSLPNPSTSYFQIYFYVGKVLTATDLMDYYFVLPVDYYELVGWDFVTGTQRLTITNLTVVATSNGIMNLQTIMTEVICLIAKAILWRLM